MIYICGGGGDDDDDNHDSLEKLETITIPTTTKHE